MICPLGLVQNKLIFNKACKMHRKQELNVKTLDVKQKLTRYACLKVKSCFVKEQKVLALALKQCLKRAWLVCHSNNFEWSLQNLFSLHECNRKQFMFPRHIETNLVPFRVLYHFTIIDYFEVKSFHDVCQNVKNKYSMLQCTVPHCQSLS